MASILKVDELQGITAAGDITVTSEGGAATQSLQQGLAKAWVNFNGTGTIAARDSLNLSSLTDNTTGKYTVNLSNAMENGNYAFVAQGGRDTGGGPWFTGQELASPTTTALRISNWNTSSGGEDPAILCVEFNGDLA